MKRSHCSPSMSSQQMILHYSWLDFLKKWNGIKPGERDVGATSFLITHSAGKRSPLEKLVSKITCSVMRLIHTVAGENFVNEESEGEQRSNTIICINLLPIKYLPYYHVIHPFPYRKLKTYKAGSSVGFKDHPATSCIPASGLHFLFIATSDPHFLCHHYFLSFLDHTAGQSIPAGQSWARWFLPSSNFISVELTMFISLHSRLMIIL